MLIFTQWMAPEILQHFQLMQMIADSVTTDGAVNIMATGLVGTWERAMTMRDQDWQAATTSGSQLSAR